MKVSAQYAEAHLPDLLEAAFKGDEVEIDISDKPTVKLVVVYPPAAPRQTGRRVLGAGVGLVKVPTEGEWTAMDKFVSDIHSPSPSPEARNARQNMFGAGIGKIWASPDAFSPEADAEIQQMFDDEINQS